jgi:hypothetical protein
MAEGADRHVRREVCYGLRERERRITPPSGENSRTNGKTSAHDVMGREEGIGAVLMKGFFETMRATGRLPHTICFLESGVNLTAGNEEVLSILKEMEGIELCLLRPCLTALKSRGKFSTILSRV